MRGNEDTFHTPDGSGDEDSGSEHEETCSEKHNKGDSEVHNDLEEGKLGDNKDDSASSDHDTDEDG